MLCVLDTYLINEHVHPEVPKRELELLEAVVDRDLDGDQGVRRDILTVVMT